MSWMIDCGEEVSLEAKEISLEGFASKMDMMGLRIDAGRTCSDTKPVMTCVAGVFLDLICCTWSRTAALCRATLRIEVGSQSHGIKASQSHGICILHTKAIGSYHRYVKESLHEAALRE